MPAQRLPTFDAIRGFAIVLMVMFHFCYDLTYFQLVSFDFYNDPFWLHSRTLIVTLFIVVSGSSLVFATANKINPQKFFKRLLLIASIALAISVVSYFLFPGRTIFFGILHFIAAASVLGLVFRNRYWLNLVLGTAIVFLPNFFQHQFFDNPWLQWLGFMTHKPATEDYVPLFPWFGVFLLGMFAAKMVLNSPGLLTIAAFDTKHAGYRGLTYFGRHSLLIYVIHQPILMGFLFVFTFFISR